MHKIALTALAFLAAASVLAQPARDGADHDAVRRAVLDYVEGLYEARPDAIERSVHADLAKYGFWRESPESPYQGFAMDKEELVQLAREWNRDGSRAGADAPKEVVVLDLLDQTASAKLTAVWGVDYLHLAKFDGRWQIAQVLWQSPPPEAPAPPAGTPGHDHGRGDHGHGHAPDGR